jgi:hypothetical protein
MLLGMFILVLRDEVEVFLFGYITADEASDLARKRITDCLFPEKTASALKTLACLARTLWSLPRSNAFHSQPKYTELAPLLITAALKYLGYGLLKTVLSLPSSKLDPTEMFSQVRLATSDPAFKFERISHRCVDGGSEYPPHLAATTHSHVLASSNTIECSKSQKGVAA